MRMAWRIFKASWIHVIRNLWIGIATIIVFAMAFLSVNTLLGTNAVVERLIGLLEERIDVTLTFLPGTPEAVVQQARFSIAALPQAESVTMISAEDSLSEFKERNKNNPAILEALKELGSNPIGAQIIIKAKKPEEYAFLLEAARNPQYASSIKSSSYNDHQEAIATIQSIGKSVRLFTSALVAVFALFGLLAAFNAVRVAIYTHREEIAIMRLVGASSAYIRMPFVLEAVWLVLFAASISLGVIWSGIRFIEPKLTAMMLSDSGLSAYFISQAPLLLIVQVGGLSLLTALVSWIAVGRYIRR